MRFYYFRYFQFVKMFMVREDGSRVDTEAAGEILDEQSEHVDVGVGGVVNDDLEQNINTELVGDQDLCRLCGQTLVSDKRNVSKSEKFLPRAFKNIYDIDVLAEADYYPKLVHKKCSLAIQRSLQKFDSHSPGFTKPALARFVKGLRKCTGCNKTNPGHNRATCPGLLDKSFRNKKVKLLDLKNRDQGNKRSQEWYEYTQTFCKVNGEDLQDLLGFTLRRVLLEHRDKKKADILEKTLKGSKTGFEAFSPRSTLGRIIVSDTSTNQFKDDYKFCRQNKKQIFASPGEVDLEKFRINQKNVSFKLTHGEDTLQYTAPIKPSKPPSTPGWSVIDSANKKILWKSYKTDLKTYKNLLRPTQILPPSELPESLRPDFYAVGNPYANILAFSLYDIRAELLQSIKSHPEIEVKDGVLVVDVIGSDGCDGAAGYGMMSKASERNIPDHSLAYDFGITEVSATTADRNKIVLYDSKKVSVYNLQPVLRAACNENDHHSTHSLTIPIELARKYLCESSMEVQLSENVMLRTNSIEIVTSKLDKKYADEQGGTGEGNFPCNLCTSSKEEIRRITCIEEGFDLNRTCSVGHEAAELRRINVDRETQEKLKRQSKGWKSVPILSSEYVRRGFDDLHDCTSWGRWLVKIIVRFRAGLFSETITNELKPLFDTAKKYLRDILLRSLGIDIHMDLKGREAQALFALKNSDVVENLVPKAYKEEFGHFLTEARFALAIVCSPDPAKDFDLKNAEPKLKRFQLWLINTWPTFIQPEYVHPTLMHTIQLLTRPGALKSISQYGTQNKEAKNKKNNQYLATMARMTSFGAALEDVYARDSLASSVEIRKVGSTHLVQHCSKCKQFGHRAPDCGKRSGKKKFVDLDLLDPVYRSLSRGEKSDSDLEEGEHSDKDEDPEQDDLEEETDLNSNVGLVGRSFCTPKRRTVHFDDNMNDSPAHRTRSKTKDQQEVEPTTQEQAGAKRKLNI